VRCHGYVNINCLCFSLLCLSCVFAVMSSNSSENVGENQDLIKKFEELYADIQKEVDFYKQEHDFLRREIVRLVQDSTSINHFFFSIRQKFTLLLPSSYQTLSVGHTESNGNSININEASEIEYKKISDAAIKSLQCQLDLCNEVSRTYSSKQMMQNKCSRITRNRIYVVYRHKKLYLLYTRLNFYFKRTISSQ
jgi:predicted O-linked N-acetylglucosamine transferase (SPINDLY family)